MRQLKKKLSNTRKEGSGSTYLLEIQQIVDALILVGAQLEESDHVKVILEGLIEECGHLSFLLLQEKLLSQSENWKPC